MYARVSILSLGPAGIEAAIRYFEKTTVPGNRALAGFKGATLLVNRDDHLAESLTYWDTPGHLQASEETAHGLQQGLMDRIEGMEVVSVGVFEVAVDLTAADSF